MGAEPDKTGWPCALCLSSAATSEEHIVPRSIGGGLALPILCKPCNDTLGHGIDADALKSGPIQHAALRLKDRVPWLWKAIGPAVGVKSMSTDVPMQVEKGTGEPQVRPHRDTVTGAINLPRSDLGKKLMRRSIVDDVKALRAKGQEPNLDVENLVERVSRLEGGEVIDVPTLGRVYVGKQDTGVEYRTGPPLSHRYPARIAYLSLIAAGADPRDPSLGSWRRYIRGEIEEPIEHKVFILRTDAPLNEPSPHHYVEVSGKVPGAWIVDVVLFGMWAWRCVFQLRRAPQCPFVVIGIDLAARETAVFIDPADFAKGIGWVLRG